MAGMRAIALCVAGALLSSLLRPMKPEMALVTALATGALAISLCIEPLGEAVTALEGLSGKAGLSAASTQLILRAVGISLVADFAAQLCRDAGESALSGRVELAGRVALLALSTPLLTDLVRSLEAMLP